jgi:predicted nucleotidyltransferase component of viral defense system
LLNRKAEVQAHFGLPSPALVEKDWYVVKVLQAIARLDTAPLLLVFGGGTALSRAHRLIRRMSEDIDLKVVSDGGPSRAALRNLRVKISMALRQAGFDIDPTQETQVLSRNQSRYALYQIPYQPKLTGSGALRPQIRLETLVAPLRDAPVVRAVSSFVSEAFQRPPEIEAMNCVSVTQTAAEKFVALTRRVAAERDQAPTARDPTLIRHLYDLHMIQAHFDARETAGLAQTILGPESDDFGGPSPAYRADPLGETLRAVNQLHADKGYAAHYEAFHREMVYDEAAESYEACLTTLQRLADHLA